MLQVYYALIALGFTSLCYLMLFHKANVNHRDW